jgi:hypothetical protein
MKSITINGIFIDLSALKRMLEALSLNNATTTTKNSDSSLVQTTEPLDKTQCAALEKADFNFLPVTRSTGGRLYFSQSNEV